MCQEAIRRKETVALKQLKEITKPCLLENTLQKKSKEKPSITAKAASINRNSFYMKGLPCTTENSL